MNSVINGVARILCKQSGYDPDYLEPGDIYGVDGVNKNGDECHFMWKEYVRDAKEIVRFCKKKTSKSHG